MKRLLLAAGMTALALTKAQADTGWPHYGGDPGGTRFSPARQITPGNAAGLVQAWTFHTGDIADGKNGQPRSGFETTPLLIDGRLYLTTPFNRVIALNPITGQQIWAFDPQIARDRNYGDGLINRGLAAWRDPDAKTACALRLFEATLDARLLALDAATGQPCADFGTGGFVALENVKNYRAGDYHMTSPPIVLDGVVVVGSAINDNSRTEMPEGVVRGFDARSGKQLWAWDPIVRPAGAADWRTGAANAWSIMSADPARHLIYVPTGSASPDYFGGFRPGDNRWANSVVALDSRSGKQVWGFQLVHHDLWDYDTAAAPLVTAIKKDGKTTQVVIAGNKTGMVYVLNPATGKPVLSVEERPVPQSLIPGESTSPTQPFPVTLPPLARHSVPEAWGISDADRAACQKDLAQGATLFTPPDLKATIAVPGVVGGLNWSGFAWDAKHGWLIAAVSNLPYKMQIIPRQDFAAGNRGSIRGESAAQTGAPFAAARMPWLAPSGLPCTPPPWGELVALDVAGGKIAWRRPLGVMDEVFPNISRFGSGSIVLGGPILTAGGLIFIAGTLDRHIRAFETATGKEVWSQALPASAHAMPITYEIGGKQYVVIAAGGSAKITEEAQSDAVIAFALPD
ncbi:MAG TPA: pyrroloquinoline quinone-dependent dehydrogenase [Rhizomicrobium sp.]|nr:pyrroloquinoline quinone-dependent dehydrogenase [Rhizomicrobium sp.]